MTIGKNIKPLYHYTTLVNAVKILQSKTIWASDSRYLNDRNELFSSIELFKRILDISPSEKENFSSSFFIHNARRAFCIFSLSESPSILSQWKSYSDDGHGICLGFNTQSLEFQKYKFGHMQLVDCVYINHEEFLESVISEFKSEIDEFRSMCKIQNIMDFWHELAKNPKPLDIIYAQLLRIKNKHFAEEKESRLVICDPLNHAKLRTGKNIIIPYLQIELISKEMETDNDLKETFWCEIPEIWLGPKSDDRNINALRVFDQFGWVPKKEYDGRAGIYKFDCGYR